MGYIVRYWGIDTFGCLPSYVITAFSQQRTIVKDKLSTLAMYGLPD